MAFGGGEPTTCEHFDEVLLAVRDAGMVPNVTTNGQRVTPAVARTFARTCGCVQISIDRPEILEVYRGRETVTRALRTAALLQDAGATVGANLLLVPENIGSIGQSLAFLEGRGFRRVVLLRPFGNAGGRCRGAGRLGRIGRPCVRRSRNGSLAGRQSRSRSPAVSPSFWTG